MNNLNVLGLTKFYGDKPALNGVTFSACDGDFIGLLGANGAGKSTLIKCLSGVLLPSGGDALFNQHSIVRSRTYTARILIRTSAECHQIMTLHVHYYVQPDV